MIKVGKLLTVADNMHFHTRANVPQNNVDSLDRGFL